MTIAVKDANGTTQNIQSLPAPGQGLAAASLPVVIASDQSAIAVSGATAVGSAPANPPLSISGVDGGGLKRHLLTDATGAVVLYQPGSLAVNQVTVASTATQIVPARAGRKAVTIVQEGTTLVRLGGSGVTAGTGVPLPGTQYSAFTIEGGAAVYGIVASGTQVVSFVETF